MIELTKPVSFLLGLTLFFSVVVLTSSQAYAQSNPCLPGIGSQTGCDPNAGQNGSSSGGSSQQGVGTIDQGKLGVPTDINQILGNVVQLAYAAAGLLFFFMFILGGIRYIQAGGDEKAVTAARSSLTQAVIGLVVVVAAFLITQLLFTLFGIKGFIQLG